MNYNLQYSSIMVSIKSIHKLSTIRWVLAVMVQNAKIQVSKNKFEQKQNCQEFIAVVTELMFLEKCKIIFANYHCGH